ncbi:hypothetical protein [Bacillus sp. 165]|uniref:hypothetical protein n=1 Tax=Bacillus sp. 165 TaxID=1529117 RepID=UPI001AD9F994|nr:hypothetical protein [Bacillus sp. 165]MBO9128532.1 hypothetical protein [Bacillus sp. 165]
MKKLGLLASVLFVILTIFSGCGKEQQKLTRVTFQELQKDGTFGEESVIADKKTLEKLASIVDEIKWEKAIPSMAREGDVKAVLYYEEEKNMPERLYEYEIWFNKNGKAEFLSNDKEKSYGKLNKNKSETLKKLLLNK